MNEVNAEPAVTVKIEQGDAGAHDLGDEVALHRTGIVVKMQPRFLGDIREPRRPSRGIADSGRIASAEATGKHAGSDD